MSHKNKKQIQTLDYAQLQQQKQDLVHCNNSFGMLLSSMESYLIKSKYNISVLFGYYNHFNDISWKTKEEIKSQLYVDLMGYKMQKSAYFQKYHEAYQPDFPPISEICKIIKKWKQLAGKKEEKKLCDEILDLINDTNDKNLSYYERIIEDIDSSSSQTDPIKSFQMSNQIHNIMDKRDEEIRNELQKNPNAKFGLEIGKQPGNSEFSNLQKDIDIKNKDPKQKSSEDKILNKIQIILRILENVSKNKRLEANSLDANIRNTDILINEYFTKYQNLNFLFQKFNIKDIINGINSIIQDYADKKNILENAKTFFEKIENIPFR